MRSERRSGRKTACQIRFVFIYVIISSLSVMAGFMTCGSAETRQRPSRAEITLIERRRPMRLHVNLSPLRRNFFIRLFTFARHFRVGRHTARLTNEWSGQRLWRHNQYDECAQFRAFFLSLPSSRRRPSVPFYLTLRPNYMRIIHPLAFDCEQM